MFKFELGEEVIMPPLKDKMGKRGMVVQQIRSIDQSLSYTVSSSSLVNGGVERFRLNECELQRVDD